ncbi:MAG TPA: flavin reductase family protein [Chloroflexota bacterium]|nr:flavin reductase family protein [Chloroflexota bacterium]
MDDAAKKTALRMIPYGLQVLGVSDGKDMDVASINWTTQVSFQPPLVVIGVKKDSKPFSILKSGRKFALSFLESGQRDLAFAFFKTVAAQDGKFGDYGYEMAETGCPIVSDAASWVEAEVVSIDETGDHAAVIGRVVNAGVKREAKPLTLAEMGVNYGG